MREIEILQMAKVREIKILHTSKSTGTSNYDKHQKNAGNSNHDNIKISAGNSNYDNIKSAGNSIRNSTNVKRVRQIQIEIPQMAKNAAKFELS